MMVSHESLDGLLRLFGPGPGRRAGDLLNARTAADHDQVVCTTAWAAAEFARLGVGNLRQIPLGVDLDSFTPANHDPRMRTM
jgi:alpha-1,6-mannosyltransferase